jgi:hypothetical protein
MGEISLELKNPLTAPCQIQQNSVYLAALAVSPANQKLR